MMHREFPRGWWRSPRRWTSGSLELLRSILAAVAVALVAGDVVRLLRRRNEPTVVASARVPIEGYLAGALLGCLGLGVVGAALIGPWPHDVPGDEGAGRRRRLGTIVARR